MYLPPAAVWTSVDPLVRYVVYFILDRTIKARIMHAVGLRRRLCGIGFSGLASAVVGPFTSATS